MVIFDRPTSQRRWKPIEQRGENTGLSSQLERGAQHKGQHRLAETAGPKFMDHRVCLLLVRAQCSGAGRMDLPAYLPPGGPDKGAPTASYFRSNNRPSDAGMACFQVGINQVGATTARR
jgi:hypothetical protein